jgi:group I intron endonuclease
MSARPLKTRTGPRGVACQKRPRELERGDKAGSTPATVVYLVTNAVSGKQYVGITRQKMQRRWRGHVHCARKGVTTALHAAIRKYGEDSFSVEVVASCLRREWAGAVEADFILQFRTKAPLGYNLTDGGDGVRGLSDEAIKRIAETIRGRKHTKEAKALIGAASRSRPRSQRERALISAAHRGKSLTEEHRAKLAAAKIGRKRPPRSETHKSRISDGLRRAHRRRREAASAGVLQ